MSYYRRRYYKSKNKGPDLFDMLAEIIIGLGIILGKLIFWLFKKIFNNRGKIKGLFKLNEKPVDPSEADIQIHTNVDQTLEPERIAKATPKYSLKESQITEAEKDFLEILKQVVGNDYRIEPQVQLSSIVRPTDSNGCYTNYTDFNRIKAKSIDFVLFDDKNKPYLAIDLDDRSHFRWDRMKRDQFVNDLMDEVGLRIIHVPFSYSYNPDRLKRQIFA
jgi:hypothetical protein